MGVWMEVRGELCKVGSLPVLPLDVGSGDGVASPVLTEPSHQPLCLFQELVSASVPHSSSVNTVYLHGRL